MESSEGKPLDFRERDDDDDCETHLAMKDEEEEEEEEEEVDYEQGKFRAGTRTPRPYYHEGDDIRQDDGVSPTIGDHPIERHHHHHRNSTAPVHPDHGAGLSPTSTTGSESGTEADDERPTSSFVKALPPATLRPRKGLKAGEPSADTLLTPSQLDDEGRRLSGQDYFEGASSKGPRGTWTGGELGDSAKEEEELLLLRRRRLAELARRSSEVGLVVAIFVLVVCGYGVLATVRTWWREIVVHLAIIALLVFVYPIKLSIVDTRAAKSKLWERFRVPASFDPATVLYPPLLPVLVALSVSPANPAIVLPNMILGLASLPQRLFPRSSRLTGINAAHWLVSILPLIAADRTTWWASRSAVSPYLLRCSPPYGLSPETLVSLYPLHHALLLPLQYLTTTSLLISELHLLSVGLINLLLLSSSPQAVILKACLWIGGVTLFVFASPVLHWNLTLVRVPKWKLRRSGHPTGERKSLVDAVTELITVRRVITGFAGSSEAVDSDADEDEPHSSIKTRHRNGRPRVNTSTLPPRDPLREPFSATEATFPTDRHAVSPPSDIFPSRPRSNTLPALLPPRLGSSRRRSGKSANLLWCLSLTPAQASQRKLMYASYVYFVILVSVLGPVRWYIERKALGGWDPFGWAIGYLLGQLPPVSLTVEFLGLDDWIPLPTQDLSWSAILAPLSWDIHTMRIAFGIANTRLLLIAYWALVLLAGLLTVFSLTAYVEVDTRRKVFHGVMVAMLLPATFVDPTFCALALALALAVFLLLEVLRAGQVPPLGSAIGRFVAPYIDGRDLRGPVVVSHIFLLIGCAVPLWFSLAALPRDTNGKHSPWSGWEVQHDTRDVAMIAGVVCVGMGDAAASLFGRRYGRHKWLWIGGKSLEGSAAFAVAVTIGLVFGKLWLVLGGWADASSSSLFLRNHILEGNFSTLIPWFAILSAKSLLCACGASFMEAVLTGANDNVVVPVALWLLVRGVRL